MSAVKVFRSSDSNAPKMGGWAGALTDVLLGCLVNGYGSVFASGTITSSGVNVSNNDTVTVDNVTYTFKTALTPAANEVLIGASAAASLANLAAAINLQGTSGTTYGASTQTPKLAYSSNVTATVLSIVARKGGTGGNSIGIAKSAATLTVSAATLAGGSGSDATAGAGWTNPLNGNGGQRVFQGGSGVQHQYHVDDATPNTTALAKEAQFRGSEASTAFQNWTNPFPTIAQFALGAGLVCRKSATADNTNRAWIVIADDRTAYVLILSGDSAGTYFGIMLGEVYSLLTPGPDSYRSMVIGRTTANSGTVTVEFFGIAASNGAFAATVGHYIARAYTGAGTAQNNSKITESSLAVVNTLHGTFVGADAVTAAIIVSPIYATDTTPALRGRMRGMFAPMHATSTFGDGDTIAGSAAYTGRTLLVVKTLQTGSIGTATHACFDITGPWETN